MTSSQPTSTKEHLRDGIQEAGHGFDRCGRCFRAAGPLAAHLRMGPTVSLQCMQCVPGALWRWRKYAQMHLRNVSRSNRNSGRLSGCTGMPIHCMKTRSVLPSCVLTRPAKCRYAVLRSWGRQPITKVSRVTTSAVKPARLAWLKSESVTLLLRSLQLLSTG